jgi:hypothetical protein
MARSKAFMNYLPKPIVSTKFSIPKDARPTGRVPKRRGAPAALSRRAGAIRRAVEKDSVTYNIYGDPKAPTVRGSRSAAVRNRGGGMAILAKAVEQRAPDELSACRPRRKPPARRRDDSAAIIHGHHNYLWPCRGIEPPGNTFLHLYACDLAR